MQPANPDRLGWGMFLGLCVYFGGCLVYMFLGLSVFLWLSVCGFGALCLFLGLYVYFWGCPCVFGCGCVFLGLSLFLGLSVCCFGAVCVWVWRSLPVFGAECFGAECVFGAACLVLGLSLPCTHPWAPRLQPECQEEEEGGGRMRWLSSCICRRMGRRSPHEMFSSPSTISSPSSCSTDRDQCRREKLGMWAGDWGLWGLSKPKFSVVLWFFGLSLAPGSCAEANQDWGQPR